MIKFKVYQLFGLVGGSAKPTPLFFVPTKTITVGTIIIAEMVTTNGILLLI